MSQGLSRGLTATVRLNDGVEMPCFGLGVGPGADKTNPEFIDATLEGTKAALSQGYRLLDTAVMYGSEENVGKALKQSTVPRSEMFIVTKLWNDKHGADLATESFHDSLKQLELDYVDLYLIHSPRGGKLIETYRALLKLKDQGFIRSVGVSNFGVVHLEGLEKAGLPTPSVNQIELHPYQNQRKSHIVEYCQEKGITLMGYCPMLRQKKNDDPILVELSKKYNKSVPQILIRWSLQRNFITIPKSINPKRIQQNADVFDFEIEETDINTLNGMPDYCCSWDPTQDPWTD